MSDLLEKFPPEQFEILQVSMPIPRDIYDGWTSEQKQAVKAQASKAVLDAVAGMADD